MHADERGVLGLGGRGEDRLGPALEPRLERTVLVRLALALDPDPTVEEAADPRARVRVPVRHAAGREVDAVAAHEPAVAGLEPRC